MDDLSKSIIGTVLGVLSSVLIAAGSYLITWYSGKAKERRDAQLKRLDEQLRVLYGPLHVLSLSSEAAWNAFMQKNAPDDNVFIKADPPPTEEQMAIWRHWIETVIMPMNDQMEKLIKEHWDLVEGKEIEPSLIQLIAHISGYRWVIDRWKASDGKDRECHSLVPFPKEFNALVRKQHDELRARQMALLGIRG